MSAEETKNALQSKIPAKRRIRGQGMTEYIIIVALIALAAIAVVGLFGETVQQQFVSMSQKLAGQDGAATAAQGKAKAAANSAKSQAGTKTLGQY